MKKLTALIITALLLTSCSPRGADIEQDTAFEETTIETEKEVNILIEDMPEIVFLVAYLLPSHENGNIKGSFIDNSGAIKEFSFFPDEKIKYLEAHVVGDFVDNYRSIILELATDTKRSVPLEELSEFYKKLMNVDITHGIIIGDNYTPYAGFFSCYGLRFNYEEEDEVIFLMGRGALHYDNLDEHINELSAWIEVTLPMNEHYVYGFTDPAHKNWYQIMYYPETREYHSYFPPDDYIYIRCADNDEHHLYYPETGELVRYELDELMEFLLAE